MKSEVRRYVIHFLLLITTFVPMSCSQAYSSQWERALQLEAKGKAEKAIRAWSKAAESRMDKAAYFFGSSMIPGPPNMRNPEIVAKVMHARTTIINSDRPATEKTKALIDRGVAFAAYKEFPLAIKDLTAALIEMPTDSDALFYRGLARSQSGDFKGAVNDLGRLLKKFQEPTGGQNFTSQDALLIRGLSKIMVSGMREEAYQDLNEVSKTSKVFQKIVGQLQRRQSKPTEDYRVYYDPWEMPDYSTRLYDDGEERIYSLFYYRFYDEFELGSRVFFVVELLGF